MAHSSAPRERHTPSVTVEELQLGDVSFYDIAEHFAGHPDFALLDSRMHGPRTAGYSLLAFAPFARLQTKGDACVLRLGGQHVQCPDGTFGTLAALLRHYAVPRNPNVPTLPFVGGAIGYFAYELGRLIETLPATARDELGLPDCYLGFYNFGVLLHHESGRMYVCHCATPEGGVGLSRDELRDALAQVEPGTAASAIVVPDPDRDPCRFTSDLTREAYCDAVRRIKEYIVAGDVYQVNMTQRFAASIGATPPWEIYKYLARSNPADYAAYLNCEGHTLVSSSPELFLRLRARHVETRPIKGTIRRGETPADDAQYRSRLFFSVKDRAELAMIVDLLRNDLGRVCVPGSVCVGPFPEVASYPSLHHLEATVTGTLEEQRTIVDLLRATFPGGSITGAPKIRAMEIIDELEPVTRGVYTGSIGYLSFDGAAELNIAIRTLIVKDGVAYVHAGGGVVADSNEADEFEESLLKANKLLQAVRDVSTAPCAVPRRGGRLHAPSA